ncbi:MAG: aminotransferase class IV [Bacteroidales bacterium]|nr:aminotransferase class IV [Bacteroidales bacterium]MBN2699768.1 aminotransferase class IV [Bacteroidales bacterium]
MIPGKIYGNCIVINSLPADASGYEPDPSAEVYYEVVRVMESRFLFLPDHLERLKKSLQKSGMDYPGDETILQSLKRLISDAPEKTGNVRISLYKNPEGQMNCVVHFVTHFYPTEEMYEKGVRTLTFQHTRPRPGVKKWDADFRKRVNDFIAGNKIYEAILQNEDGTITEGSRSNIFFISRTGDIVSAPSQVILQGITRKYVIEIIQNLNVPLKESLIHPEHLDRFESCFITGTSPKVLPVYALDHVSFNAGNPLLRSIMDAFNSLVGKHLTIL